MDEETEEYEDHGDGKSSISADLIRGHINTIILRSLYERDMYGYEIMNDINKKSHGQYTLKQPTLYSALKRLETQGYIQAYWKTDEVSSGGRRKYFRLTESGKEVAEKNIAEWEYSRTVIDSLISDENFDFSQPAPTHVDFKILRQSTSRVYTGSGGDNGDDIPENDAQPEEETKPDVQAIQEPVIETVSFTSTQETTVVLEPEDINFDNTQQTEKQDDVAENSDNDEEVIVEQSQVTETDNTAEDEPADEEINATADENQSSENDTPDENQTAQQTSAEHQVTVEQEQNTPPTEETQQQESTQPQQTDEEYDAERAAEIAAAEEQRRISHEIYEKLIAGEFERKTEPEPEPEPQQQPQQQPEPEQIPQQQEVPEEPQYNVYATRPETERDYRNLVDKIFEQTVRPPVTQQSVYEQTPPSPPPQPQFQAQPEQQQTYQQPPVQIFEQPAQPQHPQSSNPYDFNDKASNDGLKVQTSDNSDNSEKAKRTTYNRGATLFTCSLIVGGIILLEFILCLVLKDTLVISFAYPFVILALGLVDILVCGILFGAGYGKQVRKPTNQGYIFTSIIITALIILIIVIFAIILNVNWSVTTDVLTKVVIPCIVALNIPIFTLSFYLLTK